MNVLDRFPKRVQPEAKEYLCKIPYAETRAECERLRDRFRDRFVADYPRAVETLYRDWERMVTFYDFPREHWRHIRTSNIVESPFSTVRLRTGAARRYTTALIWKVLMVVEKRFRKLNAPHLLSEVYEGIEYRDGIRLSKEHGRDAARAGKKASQKKGYAYHILTHRGKLYAIEKKADEQELSYEERCLLRQKESRPVLEKIKCLLDEAVKRTPPKGLLGKTVAYALDQWERLERYTEDGRLRTDNNMAENAIRPFVVGRKNWLFSGSPRGAKGKRCYLQPDRDGQGK